MTKTPKTRTKWLWLKRGLFAVAVLITLVALAVVFENWRGRRAWATYRAELEAKGEVLDWRKLVPQHVPDDLNLTKTPFLAPLTEYHRNSVTGEAIFDDPEGNQRITSLFAWRLGINWPDWRRGKSTDWSKIQAELRKRTNSSSSDVGALLKRPPEKPYEDVLFLFSLHKSQMDELSAAVKCPFASFNTEYGEGFGTLVSQLSAIKSLIPGFTLKARAELAADNSNGALDDWQTSLGLIRALDGDPVLIGLLIKLGAVEWTLNPVWEGLAQHRWNEPQLIRIQDALRGQNIVADAKRMFTGERAISLLVMDQLLRPGDPYSRWQSQKVHWYLLPGWLAQNKIAICRIYSDFMLPHLDATHRLVDVENLVAQEHNVIAEFRGRNPYRVIAKWFLPSIAKTIQKVAHAQISVDLATVACALERSRIAEGKNPATLTALAPRFLDSIPLDLDKKPLRYELQADGSFILYSIGVDLKDDHGRIGKADGTFTTDEGDWVWKYPRASE